MATGERRRLGPALRVDIALPLVADLLDAMHPVDALVVLARLTSRYSPPVQQQPGAARRLLRSCVPGEHERSP
jgi:hypothetical protein